MTLAGDGGTEAFSPTASASEHDPSSLVPHPPPPKRSAASRAATWVAIGAVVAVGVGFLVAFFATVRHWVAFHTGLLNAGPDPFYNFWSGFGSDLGEFTVVSAILVGVYTGAKRVNCHTKGCWRIGRYHLEGTPYVLCRHHHPEVPNRGASHDHIIEAYREHLERRDAA